MLELRGHFSPPRSYRRDKLLARLTTPGASKIFLSYAWKDDQPFVERLYNNLEKLGYRPWMDKRNMPSRRRCLPREVEEQLQACDRVIAVIGLGTIGGGGLTRCSNIQRS